MDDRCGRGKDDDDDLDVDGGGGVHDGGRSLLSAKLAAYGESLALERRLKEAEEENGVDEMFEVGVGRGLILLFLRGMSLVGEGVIVQGSVM